MAGLLDFFGSGWEDPKSNAVMALAGGLLDGDFASGMKGYAQTMAGAGEAKFQKAMQQAKLDEMLAQTGAKQDAIKQAQLKADEAKRINQLVAGAGRPTIGSGATGIVNDALPEIMRIGGMDALPSARQAGDIDYTSLMQQGVPFDILKNLAASRNLGREEVARVQDIEGANGGKTLQGYDKYGRPVGVGANGYIEPKLVNLGDKQVFTKPMAGLSMNMGQSPDSKASNALGWANHGISAANLNLSRDRLNAEKSDPKLAWNESLGGFVNPRTREVLPALDAKGNPMASNKAEKALTEGERKAATLLQRLEGSENQLNTALSANPSAAKPGLMASALRSVGAEALANTTAVGSERQRVESAQMDILDAALTLGTGAAYTKEQLEGYRKSYFPQIGDTKDNVADKKVRLENVIQAAKIAAGRAASQTTGAQNASKQNVPAQPMKGMVMGGYRFKGGDPANQANWEKQ
jgi:hypothetical protein